MIVGGKIEQSEKKVANKGAVYDTVCNLNTEKPYLEIKLKSGLYVPLIATISQDIPEDKLQYKF